MHHLIMLQWITLHLIVLHSITPHLLTLPYFFRSSKYKIFSKKFQFILQIAILHFAILDLDIYVSLNYFAHGFLHFDNHHSSSKI
jgi:hypothetical protein